MKMAGGKIEARRASTRGVFFDTSPGPVRRILSITGLLILLALTFAARCQGLRDVFVNGRVYFTDADCYSRMTRARIVSEHPGTIVRHHDFENWPRGVDSHTTAPLDYAIVALKWVADGALKIVDPRGTSVLRAQTLDLAGALISPLFGVLGAMFLAVWVRALRLRFWGMAILLYAVSPIIVHGTALGRPDHQSLLMLTLLVALGAELAVTPPRPDVESDDARSTATVWGIVSGVAWALALWVSLYEPLVLLAAVIILRLAFDRRGLMRPERLPGAITFAAILALAFLIEGWRIHTPDAALRSSFGLWQRTVGELSHLDLRSPLLYHWLGWTIIASPALLLLAARKVDRRALPLMLLLAAALALTIWQVRWGYFLAIIFVLALPWQMQVFKKAWLAWVVFVIALWPVAWDWELRIFPEDHENIPGVAAAEKQRIEQRAAGAQLRDLAEQIRGGETAPFLAPWWISPAIAYWTGQPGVAGSSHEALPGTMESARFFLAAGPERAEEIVHRLGVRYVFTEGEDADGTSRLVKAYAPLLDGKTPPEPWGPWLHEKGRVHERVTADDLHDAPPELREKLLEIGDRIEAGELGSAAFSCIGQNTFYKLFIVKEPNPAP
jgi:hypothetical protein